jgi:hypothetical protein
VAKVVLAAAPLDPQKLASLLDAQPSGKALRTHGRSRIGTRNEQSGRTVRDRQLLCRSWPRRPSPSSVGSLAADGRPEPLATATTTVRNDLATVAGSHPGTESVSTGPADVVGLISSLGHVRIRIPTAATNPRIARGVAKGPDR